MTNIAILASGGGSNARAVIDAVRTGIISNARIALLISNNSQCGAMQSARDARIPTVHISSVAQGSQSAADAALLNVLAQYDIGLVVLAGYMKKIPAEIIRSYHGRIINIHPSLLPKYGGEGMYGLNVHRAVLDHREPETGATVHYVDEEYDNGDIIMQMRCPVYPDDTPESLQSRVKELEHQLLPQAIAKVTAELERK